MITLNSVPRLSINNNSAKHENYKNNIVLLTIGKYALCRCRYYKSLIRTGWHFSLASMYWAVFSVLFIGSDLWLHHKISRLIALSILALAYLMSFEYYLFCDEYRFVVHQGSSGKIFLADIGKFHEYWFYQGLLVAYLLLTIGVSHLLRRKKLLTNRDNA